MLGITCNDWTENDSDKPENFSLHNILYTFRLSNYIKNQEHVLTVIFLDMACNMWDP